MDLSFLGYNDVRYYDNNENINEQHKILSNYNNNNFIQYNNPPSNTSSIDQYLGSISNIFSLMKPSCLIIIYWSKYLLKNYLSFESLFDTIYK